MRPSAQNPIVFEPFGIQTILVHGLCRVVQSNEMVGLHWFARVTDFGAGIGAFDIAPRPTRYELVARLAIPSKAFTGVLQTLTSQDRERREYRDYSPPSIIEH